MYSKCIVLSEGEVLDLLFKLRSKYYNFRDLYDSFNELLEEEIDDLIKREKVRGIIVWLNKEEYENYEPDELYTGKEFVNFIEEFFET